MALPANEAMEKVELLEELQATFKSGLEPTEQELSRAAQLGINVQILRSTYEDTCN